MSHSLKSLGTLLVSCGVLSLGSQAYGSLVFHTGFNEGSGNPSGTYLGSNVTGTVGASVGYDARVNPIGGSGYSMSFPGTQPAPSYAVDFATPALNNVDFTSGTVASWINMETFASTGGNRIFTTRTAGGGGDAFDFYIFHPSHSLGGRLELHAGNGTSFTTYNTGGPVFSNDSLKKWYFVAVTWDAVADRLDFYIGNETGALNHVNTIEGIDIDPQHHGSTIRLGAGPTAGNVYRGLIDEFYLYDHALSASDLEAIMAPEPASAVMVAMGALLVLRRRRD